MSKLTVSIKNYHSIGEAKIDLDGITVLTGPNGSGKSTLSRWLFYFLRQSKDFKKNLLRLHYGKVRNLVTDLTFLVSTENAVLSESTAVLVSHLDDGNISLDEVEKALNAFLDRFEQEILNNSNKDTRNLILNSRIFSPIYRGLITDGIISEKSLWPTRVKALVGALRKEYKQQEAETIRNIKERKLTTLRSSIQATYNEYDSWPDSLEVVIDGLPLIKKSTFELQDYFDRMAYVDSPMATTNPSNYKLWKIFRDQIKEHNAEITAEASFCSNYISRKIGGKVQLKKDPLGLSEELYITETATNYTYRLDKAATGIKTFAYMQRLIDTGALGPHSLLLIDEPEAHLHPQWVVEMARVLVFLHKRLGVKIMIASHDPDMVEAIRSIAQKEGVGDATKFYLAAKNPEIGKYLYQDLGMEIGEIFSSFNLALTKIDTYGNAD
ncbi:MAG: ATP-binding protein [Bacteroidales bacterium]|nr:ATP-binding protein [Bacteroidales bacterium]